MTSKKIKTFGMCGQKFKNMFNKPLLFSWLFEHVCGLLVAVLIYS